MQFKQQTGNNSVVIIVLLTDVFWSFVAIYAVCEFGQKLTNAFDNIEYETGQLRWYFFPIQLHRILPIFMIVSQRPVDLRVIGSISSDRITFKNVSRIIIITSLISLGSFQNANVKICFYRLLAMVILLLWYSNNLTLEFNSSVLWESA